MIARSNLYRIVVIIIRYQELSPATDFESNSEEELRQEKLDSNNSEAGAELDHKQAAENSEPTENGSN